MERYEKASMQQRVGKLYMSFVGMKGNEEMRIIDAGRSKDEVAHDILEHAVGCIENIDSIGSLRTLGPLPFDSD